ncbi:MAG: acetylxylan esterase [Prolixibacteraceae bacterium]|nr:acetylxylan esterase [Prolixibacteraceae bacterium]
MNRIFITLITLLLSFNGTFSQNRSESVFTSSSGGGRHWMMLQNNHRSLYNIIYNEAVTLLDERAAQIEQLKTKADWINYRNEIKPVLCAPLAQFKKTPLNAKVTGTLEREKFTVEKVMFESHPGFYVTAGMFIPKERQHPAPCVIYVCGHTDLGFRSETYQHVILNLVDKGFIVLGVDPIGQGERMQYIDPETNKSKIGGATREHSYAGVQTLLAGTGLTSYFIWDGVRALDYLETRKEVDTKRIGITGRSGGGTQSAIISACDDRIYASAPECYITNFNRLLQSIGPQDAEQNPYKAIAGKFDHPDFLHARAPKPTLLVTTTHDFFSQQGARETFEEARKSYTALGKPENIEMVEDLGIHQSTKNNREAVYAFFQKHLNQPGDNSDIKTEPFKLEELFVTSTGQLATSVGGKTVYDLNKEYFKGKNFTPDNLKETVAETAGIKFNRRLTASVFTGKIFTEGEAEVEKYFLENDRNDYALPVYMIKKAGPAPSEKVLLWLHPGGKSQVLKHSMLDQIINSGYTVVTADLPGTGELSDPEFTGDGIVQQVPFNYTFGANLIGKSVPGIQAEGIDLVMQFIKSDRRMNNPVISALTQGTAANPFMHYVTLKSVFEKIVILDSPVSSLGLIEERYYEPALAYAKVPGSVLHYDIDDLISQLPENDVRVYKESGKEQDEAYLKKVSGEIITFLK